MSDRREYQRQKMAEKRSSDRDIVYPAPENMRRRRRLEKDLGKWLKWYAAEAFPLAWAPFHKKAIRKMQVALEQGGNFAQALPRGSGKTTLMRWAGLYGILRGLASYGLLVAATGGKSTALLTNIKTALRFNQRLAADYPEVCYPVRALKGVGRRAETQTAFGEPTEMIWTKDELVFPNTRIRQKRGTKSNPSAGARLECCGITGDVRGAQIETPDGKVKRPDFVLVDDPQTKASAKSETQTDFRLGVILEDIAGSAGPGESISIFVACTVICAGDLSDQILDREAHPDFRGERESLLASMPSDMDLWEEYNKARVTGIEEEDHGARAKAFYLKHRAKLDAGAVATWPDRYEKTEVSAIQYALNLFLKWGEKTFRAEYQNDPVDEQSALFEISEKIVSKSLSHIPRGVVPADCNIVTMMADCNYVGINWCVAAFDSHMAGFVIDYGKYPEGRKHLYNAETSKVSEEQAVFDGVVKVGELVLSRQYVRGGDGPDSGERVALDGIMFDANWLTSVVEKAVKSLRRKHGIRIRLSRSRGSRQYRPPRGGKKPLRRREHVHEEKTDRGYEIPYNGDYWQMKAQQGFALNEGAPESFCLFGSQSPQHERFAKEVCAQKLYQFLRGEAYDAYGWTVPNGPNDLLDAVKGTRALAQLLAPQADGSTGKKRKRRKRKTKHQTL